MISLFRSIYSTIVYFNIFNITYDSVLPSLPPTLPQTLPCSFKSIASFFISCYYICILYAYMSLYIYIHICTSYSLFNWYTVTCMHVFPDWPLVLMCSISSFTIVPWVGLRPHGLYLSTLTYILVSCLESHAGETLCMELLTHLGDRTAQKIPDPPAFTSLLWQCPQGLWYRRIL